MALLAVKKIFIIKHGTFSSEFPALHFGINVKQIKVLLIKNDNNQ